MLYTLTQEEYDALKNSAKGERQQAFREVLQYLSDNVKTYMETGFGAFGDKREPVIHPRQLQKIIVEAREKFVHVI